MQLLPPGRPQAADLGFAARNSGPDGKVSSMESRPIALPGQRFFDHPAGTSSLRRFHASQNAGLVATVSAFALMVL